jgi:Rrf2 family protein
MNLSNTAQYAIRILAYMAVKPGEVFSAGDIVKELKISDKYLKRLMTTLSKARIVRSIQGRNGGFVFQKLPENISLSEIINAVENIEKYQGCILGFSECSDENPCALHERWSKIKRDTNDLFFSVTLAQFVEQSKNFKY